MALTHNYPGQITDFVAAEVIPNLTTVTAPLNEITTDFSRVNLSMSRQRNSVF